MTIEIERKFLVGTLPDAATLGVAEPLRQGYLAERDGVAVRVRIADHRASLTIKAGSGRSRIEVDVPISAEQAEALWPLTAGQRIEKCRYRIALEAGLVAEVDVYAGDLAGLCTVEVEFDDDSAAEAFRPPSWFGSELTGDPRWSNTALARDGVPPAP